MGNFIEETGEVIEITGDNAKVLLHRNSSCDKCGACGMEGKPRIVIEVINRINAKEGDAVILQMQPGYLFKAAFIMYTIPLIMLILGFLAGQRMGLKLGKDINTAENIGIFTGFTFLAFSYLAIRWRDRKHYLSSKFRPFLVGFRERETPFSTDRQK